MTYRTRSTPIDVDHEVEIPARLHGFLARLEAHVKTRDPGAQVLLEAPGTWPDDHYAGVVVWSSKAEVPWLAVHERNGVWPEDYGREGFRVWVGLTRNQGVRLIWSGGWQTWTLSHDWDHDILWDYLAPRLHGDRLLHVGWVIQGLTQDTYWRDALLDRFAQALKDIHTDPTATA